MSKHFNKLTPAEAERLACLAEECGEVVQVIGKILRHGYRSVHPDHPHGPSNRELLEKELGDVYYAIEMMEDSDDVDVATVGAHMRVKEEKIKKYLHHQ